MCYYHAFCEPRKEFVSHTATPRAILEVQEIRDAMGLMFDECWQGYSRVANGSPLNLRDQQLSHSLDFRSHAEIQKPGD